MIEQVVYGLPLWALGFLVIAISLTYVVLSVTVVHRMGWGLDPADVGSATVLHAFVSVVYAVALALIVVNVQTEFSEVQDAALTEASKVSDLYRDLDGLAEPDRGQLQAEIRRYVDLVLDQEWPAANQGRVSLETDRAIYLFARHVIQMHLATSDAQVVQSTLIEDIDDVLDARHKRIFLGDASIGPIMWLVIGLGGMITIGFAAMFPMRSVGRQITALSFAASMFALMIFLVLAMDRPMLGHLSVQPDAFRDVKAKIAELVREK